MSLYEINQLVSQLSDMLSEGEIDEQTYKDTMESLGGEIEVGDIVKAIRNKSAEAEAYKAKAKKLSEKAVQAENSASRLKALVLDYLLITGQTKLTAGLFKVSVGSRKSVDVINESDLPSRYLTPQPPKIDKKAILKSLTAGETVPGAELKDSKFITIR